MNKSLADCPQITMKAIILALIITYSSLTGCAPTTVTKSSEEGKFIVDMIIKGSTLKKGKNVVHMMIYDSNKEHLAGLNIEVTPWMTTMGHGVMLVPRVTEKGNGKYRIEDIQITMKGLWALRIKIVKDDIEDMVVFEFPDV